jgi:putative copper export protein
MANLTAFTVPAPIEVDVSLTRISPPVLAAPAPSTPLGPLQDSAVAWTTWVTVMGFVGVLALALLTAAPVATRIGTVAATSVTTRLARVAVVLGVLAMPAVLTDIAHDATEGLGYDYGAAWNTLFDGTNEGRVLGLEVTLLAVGIVLTALLCTRAVAAGRWRTPVTGAAVAAGALALGTTKFPDEVPEQWGRTIFETGMWMLHLLGGGVWIGGLIGLLALALPGGLPAADRTAFWSPAIRRFSLVAMTCVGAIALSGLWLYWTHVDGPTQLFTTMYGRVLGVKILIFGSLLLLGIVNQFVLHPRIDALRAAGDERPLRTVLVRDFPAVVAAEVVLALSVLMVAPFLHGSARNQAFQTGVAHRSATVIPIEELPRIADKAVTTSTWLWGTGETLLVITLMTAAYLASGQLAKRRTAGATPDGNSVLVDA